MASHLSPLQRRAESMLLTHNRIAEFLTEVLASPTIYREDVIEELKDAVARLTAGEVIAKAPTVTPDPTDQLRNSDQGQRAEVDGEADTLREKMLDVFQKNGNEPMSFHEIAAKIPGVSHKSIQTVIYKRSFGQFQKRGSRQTKHAPQSLWNLTDNGLKGVRDSKQKRASGIEDKPKPARIAVPEQPRNENSPSLGG